MTVDDILNPAVPDAAKALAESQPAYEKSIIELADNLDAQGEPLIDVRVTLPAATAVVLKHRTHGKLDIAETLSLIAQLYCNAPIDKRVVVLDSDQYGRLCTILGSTPQDVDTLIATIAELTRISFGGVRIQLTHEEVEIINARNATGLSAAEWARQIFREMFDAWRFGRI